MTDIETSEKQELNEAATITISAETGAEISDMIASMQGNAGMQTKPVGGDMPMPMRHDIEKFRAAMDDDPSIPGKDDVDGDQDLKAGLIGALAGGAAGAAVPGAGAALGGIGGMAGGALGGAVGGPAGATVGSKIGSAIGKAAPSAIGAKIGDKLTGEEVSDCDCGNDPCDCDDANVEGYDNEPNAEYQDQDYMTKDIAGGLNRQKKAYAATQLGDNPMAVETVKERLMSALAEKKMPMGPGPDGKKGTDDDKPAFLDQKTGDKKSKGSKPKKGEVPPQFKKTNEGEFKKTGRDGDGSAKFDEMGCKEEMKKLNASGCAKMEMYKKVHEKYGCSKGKFEKLYASHCA